MLTIRHTAKWVLLLLFASGSAGGAYVYHLWTQSDELLRGVVQQKLGEQLPGWDFRFARCRFDLTGRIRLYDVELFISDDEPPLAVVPEIVLTVDRTQIASGNPTLRHIRFIRPKLLAARDADGQWNFQKLPPVPMVPEAVPEMQVDDGVVTAERHDIEPVASVTIAAISARIVPAARRDVNYEVTARPPHAESVSVNGHVHLDGKTWSVTTSLQRLDCGAGLLELISSLSPELKDLLTQWNVRGIAPDSDGGEGEPFSTPAPSVRGETAAPSEVQVGVVADVGFRLTRLRPDEEPETSLSVHLVGGEVRHTGYRLALRDLTGDLSFKEGLVKLASVRAVHGRSPIVVSGQAAVHLEGTSASLDDAEFNLNVQKLPFDEQTRSVLSGKLLSIYDDLSPEGYGDLEVKLRHVDGQWLPTGRLSTRAAAVTHVRFPYRADQIVGAIDFSREQITFKFQGMGGQYPAYVVGRVDRPGPEASVVVDIRVPNARYDERIRAAMPEKIQTVIDHLQASGRVGGYVRISRPPGLGKKFTHFVSIRVSEGTALPKCFPYPLTDISGLVEGGGESWTFTEFKGSHAGALVNLTGGFRPDEQGTRRLSLGLDVRNSAFDSALMAALPARWQLFWQELNPEGALDAVATVDWTPGSAPSVELKRVQVRDGAMELRSFPYPFDDIQTKLSFKDGVVTLLEFSGRHEETTVSTQGIGRFEPDGEWRMRLENLRVDDLVPDRRFRKALPTRLRDIIDTLDPRKGMISLEGMLEFRGTGSGTDPVTAAWDLNTIYSGASVSAGVDLDNLHGAISSWGTWNGEKVAASGQIGLDSLTFRGYQLTQVKGPIEINGTQLVIGHKLAVDGVSDEERPEAGDPNKRLTARFIDGTILLDGIAVLEQKTSYRVRLLMQSGKLEQYARLYLPGRNKLMGIMNGWLDLSGSGMNSQRLAGRGQLLISPAALYELPVVLALFRTMFSGTPDNTAFRNAFFDFDVGGGQFQFRKIDLIGDSMSLRGNGWVKFDGPLSLDFYSSAGRNQVPIPLLREVLRESTTGMWGVHVRGTLSNPQAQVEAAPRLNSAIKQLLGMGEGRMGPMPAPRIQPPAANRIPAQGRQAGR